MSFSRISLAVEIAKRLGSRQPKKLAKSIAAYLIENDKTSELNSLQRDIMQIRGEESKTVELTAITAHHLEQAQLRAIERLVKKIYPDCREVFINQTVDESVVGGVRLEFANQLLDLSASYKLNKLRQLTS
jgi:F0F1-type ATP synthase delta subunit